MSQPPTVDYQEPGPHSISNAAIGSRVVGGLGALSLLHSLWDSLILSILGGIFGLVGVTTRPSGFAWLAFALNVGVFLLSVVLLVRH